MRITAARGGRALATGCLPDLDRWTSGYDAGLHSGDVGWHLRFPDQDLLDAFRGWRSDPDPWVLLYGALGPDHAAHHDPCVRTLDGDDDVAARVAVQRSAFAPGSTFSADLWARMASGTPYDRRFEMVCWTDDGQPAAAATGWFAGPGRCAILEPVGTHADHQRRGYGRRVNLGVMAALARAGASGVRVHTPAANPAAVATYEACGLRQVDWTTALQR